MANKQFLWLFDSCARHIGIYLGGVSAAAIFDLDNTLVRGSSLFHFGVHLSRKRFISPIHVMRHVGHELAYVHRRGEREGLPSKLAERMLRLVEGRSQSALTMQARAFVGLHLRDHLFASTLAEVMAFQFRGVPVFLATASPQELADEIARELGLAGAIGTVAEVRDDLYTGRLATPIAHGMQKASRVRELMAERGYDAHDCWAYSDSVNDLPLLACVGHPVAVNPDRTLKRLAQLNDWRILPGSGTRHRPVRGVQAQSLP